MAEEAKKSLGFDPLAKGFREHPRHFEGSELVYPVLSRRSGGISIGVNLSPGQQCNFHCLYCQVHRGGKGGEGAARVHSETKLSLPTLERELREVIEWVISGRIYTKSPFAEASESLRVLKDIALSGDGEPTLSESFAEACRICAEVKEEYGLKEVALVVLTNATGLDRPEVQQGLEILYSHQGVVWAKLDAGTEEYYHLVNESSVAFAKVLENILQAARRRALVIQTLVMEIDGQALPAEEVEAYVTRLGEILAQGGGIELVQLHTIARPPREVRVSAVSLEQLDLFAQMIRSRLDVPVRTFAGR